MFDSPWFTPALILAAGIAVGWVADRVVRAQLERWARGTAWKGDDVILTSLRGIVWLWVSLLALWIAAQGTPERWVQDSAGRACSILFIISLTVALARCATGAFTLYATRLDFRGSATVVPLMIRVVFGAIGALVVLQTEGFSIAPVLTALGVGGLAVALALQDTLGNLFAGVHTLIAGQIRPGDFIRLDAENEGYVVDIGWRNTSLRTLTNNIVVVPNKKLGESIVTNHSLPEPHLALRLLLEVVYDSDLEHIERVLDAIGRDLIASAPGVSPGSAVEIRYMSFNASSITVRFALMVIDMPAFYRVRHAMIKQVHARFAAEGIRFAVPVRAIQMGDHGAPPARVVPVAAEPAAPATPTVG